MHKPIQNIKSNSSEEANLRKRLHTDTGSYELQGLVIMAVVITIALTILDKLDDVNHHLLNIDLSEIALPRFDIKILYWILGFIIIVVAVSLTLLAFTALVSVIARATNTRTAYTTTGVSSQEEVTQNLEPYPGAYPGVKDIDYHRYEAKMISKDEEDVIQLLEITFIHGVLNTAVLQEETLPDDIDEAVIRAQEYEASAQRLHAQINAKEKAREAKQKAVKAALSKRLQSS